MSINTSNSGAFTVSVEDLSRGRVPNTVQMCIHSYVEALQEFNILGAITFGEWRALMHKYEREQ